MKKNFSPSPKSELEPAGYTLDQMYADLSNIAGCTITTRTDKRLNHHHFKSMLDHLKSLGFKQIINRPEPPYDHSDLQLRPPNMASKEQVDKIAEMWRFVNHSPSWIDSLNQFLQNRFQVNDYRWMKKKEAEKVIEALKSMYMRKVLKLSFAEIYGDREVVGNRLLGLYKLIHSGFSRQEMAAFLTVLIMGEEKFDEQLKNISKIIKQSNFNKLIGE